MLETLFGSDNQARAHPDVLLAISKLQSRAIAYGDDSISQSLDPLMSDLFERRVYVFLTTSGTAANALGLALITPPYGETLCHENAHILTTEAGAPEFFAGGSRLVGLPGPHGKLEAAALDQTLKERLSPSKHHMKPSSLSLTQATEFGTVYSIEEISALCGVAHRHGLRVHMDGARFANALVFLNCTPAEMTWKSGVDVVSFGTSKNGTINAEAIVVFNEEMADRLALLHKRSGHLTAKMQYMSVQLETLLKDNLWIDNATRANVAAGKLSHMLRKLTGVNILHPIQSNQIFAEIPDTVIRELSNSGVTLRAWGDKHLGQYRLVTSFDDHGSVERFSGAISI